MALDERQKLIKRTFTKEQLEQMSIEDLVALVGEARAAGGKFSGRAVVVKADGTPKFDSEEVRAEFEKAEAEEAKNA